MTDSEIREAIERVYGELLRLRNALPPPAPCKPVSADERMKRAWERYTSLPLRSGAEWEKQIADCFTSEVREAESAALHFEDDIIANQAETEALVLEARGGDGAAAFRSFSKWVRARNASHSSASEPA